MVDRPILFSGRMVRAILDGRKTQTRRVLNPQPPADMGLVGIYAPQLTAVFGYATPDADHKVSLGYMPGGRLWVREAWRTESKAYDDLAPSDMDADHPVIYEADADWSANKSTGRIRASMHMPRWASRITLLVTDVRVRRLQDTSEDDARAEGVERDSEGWRDYEMPETQCCADARASFRTLWDSINAKRGFGWDANPWVVAVTFERMEKGNG